MVKTTRKTPLEVEAAPIDQTAAKADFGRRLYRAMNAKGWRQSDLASAAGVTRDHISRYIKGKSFPSDESLMKIAHALDKKPEELLPQRIYARYAVAQHGTGPFVKAPMPFTMITEDDNPDVAWIAVSRPVTMKTALEIGALLHNDNTAVQIDRRASGR